jgi:hypothetical protein
MSQPTTPDSFLAALAGAESFPDNYLFLPDLAQQLLVAYLADLFDENPPFSSLPIVEGGAYDDLSDTALSVVATTATPSSNIPGHPARTVQVAITLHSNRDLPQPAASAVFSALLVVLQQGNLQEQLPAVAVAETIPVELLRVRDLGESQQVDSEGRRYSKTIELTLAPTGAPPTPPTP